ncbi:hypothetical protein J6I39_07695 [bacterium]|nr:hypothetical protein [bacterium]
MNVSRKLKKKKVGKIMSESYSLITPISTATYSNGTKVIKQIHHGDTGLAKFKYLQTKIYPTPNSKLGKMGIKMVERSKDLLKKGDSSILSFFIPDKNSATALVGESFAKKRTKDIKFFLEKMNELTKGGFKGDLIIFIRKLAKV